MATPRVVVKFRDILPNKDALECSPNQYVTAKEWKKFLEKLPEEFQNISIERRLKTDPQHLVKCVTDAKECNPRYRPSDNLFLTYFAVNLPPNTDPQIMAKMLRALPNVELTYVEGRYSGPSNGTKQGYLEKAPEGIAARYIWGVPGGDGGGAQANLAFVDIEQGWRIAADFPDPHKDLPTNIQRIFGDNQGQIGHGTAVLGIVLAVPNMYCAGIAQNVQNTMVASYLPSGDVSAAIEAAYNHTKPGDVILLEVQTACNGYYRDASGDYLGAEYEELPIEVEPHAYDLISLATASGRIVIEAAGNAGLNLDDFSAYSWWDENNSNEFPSRLNRNTPEFFKDSGAVMVAGAGAVMVPGARYTGTHVRLNNTNYGSRIDCYAWGENVQTPGYLDDHPPPDPTTSITPFDGTSAAAAIVAGAALAIQGVCDVKRAGARFSSTELRDILSDWKRSDQNIATTGNTLSAKSTYPSDTSNPLPSEWNADEIGVMPNLLAILKNNQLT